MRNLKIIEKMLVENGRIVDHSTVSSYFSHLSNINNKINSLIDKGLLVGLKKGVYYISKLGTLGYASISSYIIANVIGENSFVSFEAALKYHGLFDQGIKRYKSISKKQYLNKKIEGIEYSYVTIKDKNYFGFSEEKVDGGVANIATKERSLLDLIEYQRTIYSVSLVIEKLRDYDDEFDYNLLIEYLSKYSQATIKTFGLIFDLLSIESEKVKSLVSSKTSTHRLFNNSDQFNSKWRIYYDSILDDYL